MHCSKFPYLLCLFLLYFANAYSQTIIEAEYFIDQDPGVGNGIPISIPVADDTITIDGEINTENLTVGEHILIIRFKASDGIWSLGNYTRFYIEENQDIAQSEKIVKAAYFIDTDPGVGNDNELDITVDSTTVSESFELDISGLEAGNHKLMLRTQAENGFWSLSNYSSFFIEEAYSANFSSSKIKKLEYFIDGPDPGFHLADSLPIVPDFLVQASDTLLLSQDTTDLGRHAVLARVLTEDDEWSLTGIGEYDYCSPEGVLGGFGFSINNNTLTFTDSSKYAVEYIWDMNNGDSLFVPSPIYTYPQGGTYNICQTVYSFCDTTITCKTVFIPTPRVKDSIPDQVIPEDSSPIILVNDLNDVFEDLDGDVLTFSVSSNSEDVNATIDQNTLTIESINDFFGKATMIVAAQGGGIFAYDTVFIEVFPVNDVPIASNDFNDVLWDEDSGPRTISTRLSNIISDVEDRRLEFSVSSDTSGLQPEFFNDTLIVNLAPNFDGNGTIFINATDDSLAISTFSFEVELLPLDDPPIVVQDFENITAFEDSNPILVTPNLSSFFLEADNQEISIEVETESSIITPLVANDSLWVVFTPNSEGEAIINVIASDGNLATTSTILVNVLPENDAPTFSIASAFEVCPETILNINLNDIVSDSDGFFSDIRFDLTLGEISQSSLFASDLTFSITPDNYIQFESNTTEASEVTLMLNATDLQNASNDTLLTIDILGASITQIGDTLFASKGTGFQWFKGGNEIIGETESKYVPTKRDFYQVAVSNGDCQVLSAPFQVTSADKLLLTNKIELFPNPVNNVLQFSINGDFFGEVHYQIVDAQGRSLTKKSILKNGFNITQSIDTENYSSGIYLLIIEMQGEQVVKKIFKN